MKNIVIINCHPNSESFNFGLAAAYEQGALAAGATVTHITISELAFDPNLRYGYRKRTPLEPDLEAAWHQILSADHLVWIHPVWWGGLPAIAKGFIDRLFLPGRAFRYREHSVWWDKLLTGKTAHIIATMDQPGWYYWLFYGKPSTNQLKRSVLQFCGVKPVKVTTLGIIKTANGQQREKWLKQVERCGLRDGK